MRPMSEILEENDPMVRIADVMEEILKLVKADQEKMEKAKLREPDDIEGGW